MEQRKIKNLGISLVICAIFVQSLAKNFSFICAGIAAVFVLLALCIAFFFKKEDSIVDKADLFLLIGFLGIYALHYEDIYKSFYYVRMDEIRKTDVYILVGTTAAAFLFNGLSRVPSNSLVKSILKLMFPFTAAAGASYFLRGSVYYEDIAALAATNALFAVIAFCRLNNSEFEIGHIRPERCALLISLLYVAVSALCPAFEFTRYRVPAFVSAELLPWYAIAALTLICFAVVGIGCFFNKGEFDEDDIFLAGLAGGVWVVKACAYFCFSLNWIAICVYVILFVSLLNGFINYISGIDDLYKTLFLNKKAKRAFMLCILGAAACTVLSVYLIYKGCIWLCAALILSAVTAVFLPRAFSGWGKNAALWVTVLAGTAFSACALTVQIGYHRDKMVLISAMLVFSAAAMIMLCHRCEVGRNKFNAAKGVFAALFAIFVFIAAFKSGTDITTDVLFGETHGGILMTDGAVAEIEAHANGKGNSVESLTYVWCDGFSYDEEDVETVNDTVFSVPISGRHLIIWAVDSNGVKTRSDKWFLEAEHDSAPFPELSGDNTNGQH